jgi:pristinamycin I synthase-3/4
VAAGTELLGPESFAAADNRGAADPEALRELGTKLGYTVHPTWSDTADGDRFEVVFLATETQALTDVFLSAEGSGRPLAELANDPRTADRSHRLAAELRRHAARRLPNHMVPVAVVVLETFPLTPNGKLDPQQLPAPEFGSRTGRPPATVPEATMAALFAEVLGLATVGTDERFFDLGGDSIRSIQLVSRARTAGFEMTPRDVFLSQTVEALVVRATQNAAQNAAPKTTLKAEASPTADGEIAEKILRTPDPAYPALTSPPAGRPGTRISRRLTGVTAQRLLTDLPRLYHCAPEHVALAALAPVLIEWRRGYLTQAGAWLRLDLTTPTADTPVRLNPGIPDVDAALTEPGHLARALKRVKEQVRAAPPATREHQASQVGLYLLPAGTADNRNVPAHALRIDLRPAAQGTSLEAVFDWDATRFTEDSVNALADRWMSFLGALAGLAQHPELGGLTASDVDLVDITQSAINQLQARCPGLIDILPLTPLQQGFLLHTAGNDGGADPYQSQTLFDLDGPLDTERLRQAAHALLMRHDNLRAGFTHHGLPTPLQVIQDRVDVPWTEHDLSSLTPLEQEREQAAVLAADLGRRFDLAAPPLIRFTLLRLAADRYRLLVSDHHILLDGWSTALVWQELFTLYRGEVPLPVKPFRDYLGWLATRDRDAAWSAWQQYLVGVHEPTRVHPGKPAPDIALRTTGLTLSPELTTALQRRCADAGLTLNTALQTAWGRTLGRLTGSTDVLFGNTVSERPADLDGIESMVGLLLNTVPLRVRSHPGESIGTTMARVQEAQLDIFPYRFVDLTEIQRRSSIGELFDAFYVFQSFPTEMLEHNGSDGLRVLERTHSRQGISHYPLGLTVIPGRQLELMIGYHPQVFNELQINEIKESIITTLEIIGSGVER